MKRTVEEVKKEYKRTLDYKNKHIQELEKHNKTLHANILQLLMDKRKLEAIVDAITGEVEASVLQFDIAKKETEYKEGLYDAYKDVKEMIKRHKEG